MDAKTNSLCTIFMANERGAIYFNNVEKLLELIWKNVPVSQNSTSESAAPLPALNLFLTSKITSSYYQM